MAIRRTLKQGKTRQETACLHLLSILLILISIHAYALEELRPITHLSPMPGPDQRAIGWEWHYVDQDNNTGKMQKTAGDDTVASYLRSDGCEWTRSTSGFAPATKWHNCPSSGNSEVRLISGQIWPLKTGNHFNYEIKGSSSIFKDVWKSKRKCIVQGQWRIKITSGEYDTFKVICKERWGKRTWWLSPETGTAVAYKQTNVKGGLLLQEMTHIVRPN